MRGHFAIERSGRYVFDKDGFRQASNNISYLSKSHAVCFNLLHSSIIESWIYLHVLWRLGLANEGTTTAWRRCGGGKANIALARKFLGVIYHTLKNNWVFADFPNFVLAS